MTFEIVSVPDVAFAPVHPPDAVQELALVEDQERYTDAPEVMDMGPSEYSDAIDLPWRLAVIAAGFTVMVLESVAGLYPDLSAITLAVNARSDVPEFAYEWLNAGGPPAPLLLLHL